MGSSRLIFLCGLMGSGKSTIGPLLAKQLQISYMDLDREIERQAGMSVDEIFQHEGEAGFRKREAAALAVALELPAGVVGLGGGAVCNAVSLEKVLVRGTLVWLDAPSEVLANRIVGTKRTKSTKLKGTTKPHGRPLLGDQPEQTLETMRQLRAPFYARAHRKVETAEKSAQAIAEELAAWTKQRWGHA